MANLSKNAFLAKYNDTVTGLYRAGQLYGIGSDDHRTLVVDMLDTFLSQSAGSATSVNVTQLFYVTPGSPPATTDWDLDDKFFNIGILTADYSEITINFLNQVYGSTSTLFVKKTISGDVVLNIPSSEQVGGTTTYTTITLSGATDTTFKIDFYQTNTTGFQPISETPETFTKIQHLSATVVVGLASNKLYKSTDSGETWSLLYTTPRTAIIDFDFSGTSNGCLLAYDVTGNYTFYVYDTIDGGSTYTQRYSEVNLGDVNNLDQLTISYVGSDDYYIGKRFSTQVSRYNSSSLATYSASGGDPSHIVREATINSTTVWWVASSSTSVVSSIVKKTGATTFVGYTAAPLDAVRLNSISAATSTLLVAVGSDASGDPAIVKSSDGGATWTTEAIDSAIGILRKVRAVSATSFVCIGDNGLGYSTDSGDSWTYYEAPVNGTALSAWDSDDILVINSTSDVFRGFGTSLGNIFHVHGVSASINPEVLKAEYTLSSSEILNSNTTAVQLVPSPGAGKMIVLIRGMSKLIYNSAAYTGNVSNALVLGTSIANFITPGINMIGGTSDKWVQFEPSSTTTFTTDLENQPLSFMTNVGNPSSGDSTLKITVYYTISDLN